MTMPNFFILGAPRSGTTALAEWLNEHPETCMSRLKEPNYFNTDMLCRRVTDFDTYLSLFQKAKSHHKAVGEATSTYLYSTKAVLNIQNQIKQPKYIALLRDPIEMAISYHGHQLFNGNENEEDFEKAWNLQKLRKEGLKVPKGCIEPKLLQYGKICLLGEQLQNLYNYVSPEDVLLLFYKDLQSDPESFYYQVLDFLGVSREIRRDFIPKNQSKSAQSNIIKIILRFASITKQKLGLSHLQTGALTPLRKRNTITLEKQLLNPNFLEYLKDYFYNDQILLKHLSGRFTANWLE